MRKVKGFSYNPQKHKHIIEHIDKQQNQSQYIWNLVEKDMNDNSMEELIAREVEKYLRELGITFKNKNDTNSIVRCNGD